MIAPRATSVSLTAALLLCGGLAAAGNSAHREHVPLPPVRQSKPYTCGPASVLSLLQYYGLRNPMESELERHMKTTPRYGTPNEHVVRELEHHGLDAKLLTDMRLDDLALHVRRGVPVLVDFQSGNQRQHDSGYERVWSAGHYAVVIGMTQRHVYFMDPWIGGARGRLTHADFASRWHSEDNLKRVRQQGVGIVVRSKRRPTNRAFLPRALPID